MIFFEKHPTVVVAVGASSFDPESPRSVHSRRSDFCSFFFLFFIFPLHAVISDTVEVMAAPEIFIPEGEICVLIYLSVL